MTQQPWIQISAGLEDAALRALDYLDAMRRSRVRSARARDAVERSIAALRDLRAARFASRREALEAARTICPRIVRELAWAASISRSPEFRELARRAAFRLRGV